MSELLLSTGTVARDCGVSHESVRRWANAGRLPVAAKTPNGERLFNPADVARFAEQRRADRGKATRSR
jgi:DNA-binding transcriptional MerR regulator